MIHTTKFKRFLLIASLLLGVSFVSKAQDLYTQTGTDITWKQIIDGKLIPVATTSNNGITGSKIDVDNNNPIINGGAYGKRSFDKTIRIHTVGNSGVKPADFAKWSRWYQEDGNTQIFRMFKDEYNVRNTRKNSARIESFSNFQYKEGAGWQEWSGRYTIVKAIKAAIMQVKDTGAGWASVIKMEYDGSITYQVPGGKSTTLGRDMEGKSFDLRIRDDGFTTEVYYNGKFIGKHNDGKRLKDTQFRWGMYVHSDHIATRDGLIFVTGAGVNRKDGDNDDDDDDDDNVTNKVPSVSFGQPTVDVIRLNEDYDEFGVIANATDADGSVAKVELYINNELVREELGAPYEWGSVNNVFPTELLDLPSGTHEVKLVATDDKGAKGTTIKTLIINETRKPFNGDPVAIPGIIEMEEYDKGGAGEAYSDNEVENKGSGRSNFRTTESVDIDNGNDGKVLAWTEENEWTEYTIDVSESGNYNFTVVYSSNTGEGEANLKLNDEDLFTTGFETSGGWTEYEELQVKGISLDKGEQVLRFSVMERGFNIDKIIVEKAAVTGLFNNNNTNSNLVVYPNPSSGTVYLNQEVSWSLSTLDGKEITQGVSSELDLSLLNSGVYLLSTTIGTQKIMIK